MTGINTFGFLTADPTSLKNTDNDFNWFLPLLLSAHGAGLIMKFSEIRNDHFPQTVNPEQKNNLSPDKPHCRNLCMDHAPHNVILLL